MRVWVVSEISAGTLNQALGVAERLSPEPVVKIIRQERGLRRLLFPFRQDRREAEPDIVVSCGRISERFVKTIKAAFGGRPFAVHLQRPAPETDCYGMIFVGQQGWVAELDGQSRFKPMLGVPNRIRAERLSIDRIAARAKWAPNNQKVVALLVGGANKAFAFDQTTTEHLAEAVLQLVSQGWKVLATMSRRTPSHVGARLQKIKHKRFCLWDFEGSNPYHGYLAAADAFVVTQDSIAMTSEAAVSGKPVYIFPLKVSDAVKAKNFLKFHADLHEMGITRPFLGQIDDFTYDPPRETERIADEIKESFVTSRLSKRGGRPTSPA
jgi:uncharacterized protein